MPIDCDCDDCLRLRGQQPAPVRAVTRTCRECGDRYSSADGHRCRYGRQYDRPSDADAATLDALAADVRRALD